MVFVSVRAVAAAKPFDPTPYLTQALEPFGPYVASKLEPLRYKAQRGLRPEDKLKSGDVAVYFNVPDAPNTTNPNAPERPAVYERALEGFSHAVVIARDEQRNLYHLDSPMQLSCSHDFRGTRPYIVLRPRAKFTKSRRFALDFDILTMKFNLIGYQYDALFNTDVLTMSPQKLAELRGEILNWDMRSDSGKPKIPDMYCSELITTIYMMLGIAPKVEISGGDLLDRGMAKDLADGKPKEDIARDSAHDIVDYFRFGYQMQMEAKQALLAPEARGLLSKKDAAKVKAEIESTRELIQKITNGESLLRDLLRNRLGLDTGADPLKAVGFYIANKKRIVRPVDILKEGLIPDGAFEIVGYYSGNMKSTCNQNELDLPQRR